MGSGGIDSIVGEVRGIGGREDGAGGVRGRLSSLKQKRYRERAAARVYIGVPAWGGD